MILAGESRPWPLGGMVYAKDLNPLAARRPGSSPGGATMKDRRDICKCEHDKSSHYWDVKGSGSCLCRNCDCALYRHVDEPGGMIKHSTMPPRYWDKP